MKSLKSLKIEKDENFFRSIFPWLKVASMDSNNIELHKQIDSLNFEAVIISTGISDIREIERTITIYNPSTEILLMSCRSSYPASLDDIDLGEVQFLKAINFSLI